MGFIKLSNGEVIHASSLPILGTPRIIIPLEEFSKNREKTNEEIKKEAIKKYNENYNPFLV